MSLNRESFQTLLANAFLVQESGIDARSLSAFVKIQRLIGTGDCGVAEAMNLVADHARAVADATGVAIALLEADQLVCRAGSGSASAEIGRHVTAILSISARNVRTEILRVENAETDSRIEAEICRQFGATSLLMLPIYREGVVAGVLEVIFSAQHTFKDREVRAYRLLAGLVEDAMVRAARATKSAEELPKSVPQAVEEIASQLEKFHSSETLTPVVSPEPWVRAACAAAGGGSPPTSGASKAAVLDATPEKSVFLSEVWRKGTAAAAAAALVIIGWATYLHHAASTDAGTVTVTESANPSGPPALSTDSKPLATLPSKTSPARMISLKGLPGFKRKRIAPNEVDYFAEDVTMRVFSPRRENPTAERWIRQVKYGNDVTVRYFASEPTGRSSASTDQTVERSTTVSK